MFVIINLLLGLPISKTYFFFGCRHKETDYLYQSEWAEYIESGALSNIYVAFSRDQEKKNYVQHEIEKNSELIWKLINNEKAMFIISGKADKMPKGFFSFIFFHFLMYLFLFSFLIFFKPSFYSYSSLTQKKSKN